MRWPRPVHEAVFLQRYKRFLADFRLGDGTRITAHCANTGSMKTCLSDGAPSILTHHPDPKRKLAWSWQALEMPDGWVGINTALANHLVGEAIETGVAASLAGYAERVPEQKYGQGSRIDWLLRSPGRPACYVEVKNTTLLVAEGVAAFPDAVTKRGAKHLEELIAVSARGDRAVLCFCVQRVSAREVRPADAYDPGYGRLLRDAVARGVEVLAYRAEIDREGVTLTTELPVVL